MKVYCKSCRWLDCMTCMHPSNYREWDNCYGHWESREGDCEKLNSENNCPNYEESKWWEFWRDND